MDWKEKIAKIECKGLHRRRVVELGGLPWWADFPGVDDSPELGDSPGLDRPPASKIALVEEAR